MNCKECNIETKNKYFCSHSCSTTYINRSKSVCQKKGKCVTCSISIPSIRKYCDSCLSTRKIVRKPKLREDGQPITKFCSICGIEKTNDNKVIHKSGKNFSYCYSCHRNKIALKCRNFKAKCVEYKGGRCEFCGYNKCQAALDFHHRDPSIKEDGIARISSRKFDERVKAELDKCYILCANCHREEHYRLSNISLSRPIQ